MNVSLSINCLAGVLINIGPLLYHYSDVGNEISIELTYEEIKASLPHFGLRLVVRRSSTDRCTSLSFFLRFFTLAIKQFNVYCIACPCVRALAARGAASAVHVRAQRPVDAAHCVRLRVLCRGKGRHARARGRVARVRAGRRQMNRLEAAASRAARLALVCESTNVIGD